MRPTLVAFAAFPTLFARSDPIPYLHNPSAIMLHRFCPALKILIITSGLWAASCSSSSSSPGNMTATSAGSSVDTHDPNSGIHDTISTAITTSYNTTSSSQLSISESGCSYVLGYATFWPGPYVITRTDSTICPSLASTTLAYTLHTCSRANLIQHLQCQHVLTQLQHYRMASVCTKTPLLRPAVHTTIPAATQNVLLWPPHAVLNGFNGPLKTATLPLPSHPLPSRQQQ